jgi:transposase
MVKTGRKKMRKNYRKPLQQEEVRAMHKHYKRGASIGDIAKMYNMSKSTVYTAFKRYDYYVRHRSEENFSEGQVRIFYVYYVEMRSLKRTSEKFGISVSVLRSQFDKFKLPPVRRNNRRTKKYSDVQVAAMHAYYLENGYHKTYLKYEVTVGTLFSTFKRAGLPTGRWAEEEEGVEEILQQVEDEKNLAQYKAIEHEEA